MKLLDRLRLKIIDWFISFIINNEQKVMDSELKEYNKKSKKEEINCEIPEKIIYPPLEFVNQSVYYKLIMHPMRKNKMLFVSSFELFPLTNLLSGPVVETQEQMKKRLNDLFILITKLDSFNNLKPVKYYWVKEGNVISFGFDEFKKIT